MKKFIPFLALLLAGLFQASPAFAVVNPLAAPNNHHGIHIISATISEASEAASLVNSTGGDWGYVTVLVESKDRDKDKWQAFFDDLRRRHLIPIVRLATAPNGNIWKLPYEGEETAWADFLDNLIWPTKNRYVVIYNEPNQGQEWQGKVDAASYAQVLDKTITALKNKNPDFFVLNAGLDASAPQKPPLFEDEETFLKEMNDAVPGIFNKLDGWVSHSYPNPGFIGSPEASGKGTVRTWTWELDKLKSLGLNKDLPVFITETGWKHAEGLAYDRSLPTAQAVGEYLKRAFENTWNDPRIVAVTPFLLNYQQYPFDHFSFKKVIGLPFDKKILGATFPNFYPHYQTLVEIPKNSGKPVQENKAELVAGTFYPSVVIGEQYQITLTFKNIGQSIWGESDSVDLRVLQGEKQLNLAPVYLTKYQKAEPGQTANFEITFRVSKPGSQKVVLQLYSGNKEFDQKPLEFNIQAKSPVILEIFSSLAYKDNYAGIYNLKTSSAIVQQSESIHLNNSGQSQPLELHYLLPDQTFQFTLQKPFYKPKTITYHVLSGLNKLDFGILQPDFLGALLHPKELWKLLPFSHK